MIYKCVQVENLVPEKRLCNEIFLIVSYEYKNSGFLLWRDITSNIYVLIVIWSICCEDIKCEIYKMCLWLFLVKLGYFVIFHIWLSAWLVRKHRGSVRNIFLTIRIWLCGRSRNSVIIDNFYSPYRHTCARLYVVDFWCVSL